MAKGNRDSRKKIGLSLTFLISSLVIGITNFVLALVLQDEVPDFLEIFTNPIYSNYRYTLLESLFDFDKFLSDFWVSLIFSITIIGFLKLYGKSDEIILKSIDYRGFSRRSIICGIIPLIIIVSALLGSFFNWGPNRPYLDGQTFTILLNQSYPEHFSEQILSLLLLFAGLPVFLYLSMQNMKGKSAKWEYNKKGIKYMIIAVAFVELMVFIFPVNLDALFTSNSILNVYQNFLNILFIIGIIGIIEIKQQNMSIALENNEKADNTINSKNENINDNLEYLDPKQPILSNKPNVKRNFIQKWQSLDLKLRKRFLIYGIFTLLGYCIIIIIFLILQPFSDFGTFRILQMVLSSVFRLFFVLFLYFLEFYFEKMNYLQKEDKNE